MLNGNRVCGIHRTDLIVHVAAANFERLLARTGATPFTIGSRTSTRRLRVSPEYLKTEAALNKWIDSALVCRIGATKGREVRQNQEVT